MDQPMMEKGGMCKAGGCGCHSMKPWAMIIVGLAFLLQAVGVLSAMVVSYVWPIALIAVGFSKMCKCCKGR
jgi:hypothetical protein